MDELQELLEKVKSLNEEEKFNEVIELLPDNVLKQYNEAELYAEKTQACYRTDKKELSNALAETALQINPQCSKALHYKGNYHAELNEYGKAIEAYNNAIKSDPEFSYPYFGLGSIYRALKQYDKSIEYYSQGIKTNPKEHRFYYNRALAFNDINYNKEALADFKRYLLLIDDKTDFRADYARNRIEELEKSLNNPEYNQISDLIKNIKGLLLFNDTCVTHYTALKTIKALILADKPNPFRLSEGAFLNDTSEGRELYNFLPEISISEEKKDDTIDIPFTPKPFIGSFVSTTKDNDLTLWRMYGKEDKEEAKGCSVTLSREALIKAIKSNILDDNTVSQSDKPEEEFSFYRVAYHTKNGKGVFTIPGANEDEIKTLNTHMNELHENVEKYVLENDIEGRQNLYELLNSIAYLFKSAEYQYEHELRLVVKGIGFKKNIDISVVPPRVYIELVDIAPLISKITLGPKVERAEEWAAAFHYTLNKSKHNAEIVISHLPFK